MDKVVLITGGAQGIGRGIAALLSARGWQVAVADLRESPDFFFIRCDVAREAPVRACIAKVLKRFGRVDALVNNAGIADPDTGPPERMALKEWNRRIATNLTGPFLMAKHAARPLRRARGAIVNIASTRALQAEPNNEAYAASKAGLIGLTQALALSLGPTFASIASAPAGSRTRRCARKIMPNIRSAASAAMKTSPSSSPTSSPKRPASSPARTSSSTAA